LIGLSACRIKTNMPIALEQPKRPAGGAWGIFLAEKRPEFIKACEGQPVSAITKLAGEKWKTIAAKEKDVYQKKYEAAKAQFDKDMASFLAAGGEKTKGVTALRTEKRKAREGKKKKDPNAPKKPAGGAYGVFLAEKRPEFMKACEGQPVSAVTKLAGEKWRALSDAAKKPYQDKYLKKQEEYNAALAEYKKNLPEDEEEDDEEDEDEEEEEEEEEEPAPKKVRKAGA